jgi:hypothetical protein
MRAFLFALLLIASPAIAGDLVLKSADGSQELRLYESKCSHAGTLAHLKPEHHDKFRNARILDRKGNIENYGCWVEAAPDTAFIIFEDGSYTDFSLSKFKDPTV